MSLAHIEIKVKGRPLQVQADTINGVAIIAKGAWLRVAELWDEELHIADNVDALIDGLRRSKLGADVFTFRQSVPDCEVRYPYRAEWDNAAVVPITTYADWLERRVTYDVRKAIRKADRAGVVIKEVPYDDELVTGICAIYNESPIRQGMPFWHYQKDFATVKAENGTHLDRSAFIGAYHQDELIGFVKVVQVGTTASTLQVISQQRHFDKKPMSALLAGTVQFCERRGLSHLSYGSFRYDGLLSSLSEFKRRNGFEEFRLPRYYVPLSVKGRLAVALNLHTGYRRWIPRTVLAEAKRLRSYWNTRQLPG